MLCLMLRGLGWRVTVLLESSRTQSAVWLSEPVVTCKGHFCFVVKRPAAETLRQGTFLRREA